MRVLLLLLLALSLPVLGEDAQPRKSLLLVAKKNLPDPFFSDSVVLITNHAGPVPVGVIINRPTEVALTKVFPDIEPLRTRQEKLFFGGPVARDVLVALFRAATPPKQSVEVLPGVYMSSSREVLRQLLTRTSPVEGLRIFAGHASWAPGQLEAEISGGSWHLADADAGAVFSKDPGTLWRQLEKRASAIKASLPQ